MPAENPREVANEAMAIRDDVKLFADVRSSVAKLDREGDGSRSPGSAEMDTAIAQLVSEAVVADEVIDVYTAASAAPTSCRPAGSRSSSTRRSTATPTGRCRRPRSSPPSWGWPRRCGRPGTAPPSSVKAGLRAKVKRLLARYDYPPDKEERAIELVLEQAHLFADIAAA